MKPWRCCVVLLVCFKLLPVLRAAEDWHSQLTSRKGPFPALRPLTAEYKMGWSGLGGGKAEISFSKLKSGNFQMSLTGRTTGLARALWRLDAKATSLCNGRTLSPIRVRQSEVYTGKSFDTKVDFTPSGPASLRVPTPADPTPAKVKRFKFTNVHDLQSALLFTRSQPLRNGDVVRLCVFPTSSAYVAGIKVRGREVVKVAGKKWNAIRCELTLQGVDKEQKLKPDERMKRASAWLSDDADRILLKIEADIFVGSVWMELEKMTLK